MANKFLGGNIYYFDTNGVVNKGLSCYVSKVAIWCNDSSSYIAVSGSDLTIPGIKIGAYNSAGVVPNPAWVETTLHPPQFFSVCSVLTVVNGSGLIHCV